MKQKIKYLLIFWMIPFAVSSTTGTNTQVCLSSHRLQGKMSIDKEHRIIVQLNQNTHKETIVVIQNKSVEYFRCAMMGCHAEMTIIIEKRLPSQSRMFFGKGIAIHREIKKEPSTRFTACEV